MIPVIDRNYDINDLVTAYLTKSRELSCNSGHSAELRYKTLIHFVIPVIDRNYNVNGAGTAHVHVVIPVIDRNCNKNDVVTANLVKSLELYCNSSHSHEFLLNH